MDIDAIIRANFAEHPAGTIHGFTEKGACTLYLSGSVDMKYARDLQRVMETVVDKLDTQAVLVIDMGYVDYISSTGVGVIIGALTQAKRRDIKFTVRDMQPKVRAIFELLGLLGLFEEAPAHG